MWKKIWFYKYYIEISIGHKGITCESLKNMESEDILTCFYTITKDSTNYLSIAYFIINNNAINVKYNFKHFENDYSDYIKSSVTTDNSKAIVCYYSINNNLECFTYDL